MTQLIVTAVEPFSKGELINRTNEIIFSKKYFKKGHHSDIDIKSKLIAARNKIWSAIFKIIAYDVLPGFLEKREAAMDLLYDKYAGHSKDRLNELYSCLFILCGELLKYIPHPIHSTGRGPDVAAQYLILDDWINQQDRLDRATAKRHQPHSLPAGTAFKRIYPIFGNIHEYLLF